ncbi:MAG: DNA primase [Anaerolineales bacterium]|nr:DNA primase [Anaerolineales bacterium]
MSTIDEVKSRIDIVDLVSESGVKLRKAGKNYTGFCPFHDNRRTPAFVVWPETGTWRCFGQCNEGGDIFKFIMKRDGLDFKEALQNLAAKAGVQVEQFTLRQQERREQNDHLRDLLEEAVLYYAGFLKQAPEVLAYLHEKRSLSGETIEKFGLGYAPPGWDNALKHFTGRGYSEEDLLDSGLLSQNDSGGTYDRFRRRIMIPIRDERGRMTGFGARIVDPEDVPKFLNSPETPLFSKGRLLYGLERARKPIRAADQAVIVEGYLDVIGLHQAGFENAVSPMGTALTEDQFRLLKRFSRNIVLALDPDLAGEKGVLRGLESARQAMDRDSELRFDVRGLLRHEARLQANLRVASLPDGLDPDEIVARDREEWPRLVEAAKPVVMHVLDTLMADKDISDPRVKAGIASQVIPLIEDLPNPIERDSYRQMLARRLKVDERTLLEPQVHGRPGRQPRRRKEQVQTLSEVPTAAVNPALKTECYCLGILLQRPELLNQLDRLLQQAGLTPIENQDFGYTDHQILLQIIRQSLDQDKVDPREFIDIQAANSLQELVHDLRAQTSEPDPVEERILEELQRGIIKMRRLNLGANINQLRFLQEEAQQDGDMRTTSYQELVLQHTHLLRDLDQASLKLSLRRQE